MIKRIKRVTTRTILSTNKNLLGLTIVINCKVISVEKKLRRLKDPDLITNDSEKLQMEHVHDLFPFFFKTITFTSIKVIIITNGFQLRNFNNNNFPYCNTHHIILKSS